MNALSSRQFVWAQSALLLVTLAFSTIALAQTALHVTHE